MNELNTVIAEQQGMRAGLQIALGACSTNSIEEMEKYILSTLNSIDQNIQNLLTLTGEQ